MLKRGKRIYKNRFTCEGDPEEILSFIADIAATVKKMAAQKVKVKVDLEVYK